MILAIAQKSGTACELPLHGSEMMGAARTALPAMKSVAFQLHLSDVLAHQGMRIISHPADHTAAISYVALGTAWGQGMFAVGSCG